MDWNGFKIVCFTRGMNMDLIDAYRDPIAREFNWTLNRDAVTPHHTMGYAELQDINTIQKGFEYVDDIIKMSTDTWDSLGRNQSKRAIKNLIRKTNKALRNALAKTYYLHGGRAIN